MSTPLLALGLAALVLGGAAVPELSATDSPVFSTPVSLRSHPSITLSETVHREVPLPLVGITITNVTQNPGAASVGYISDGLWVNYTGGGGSFTVTWTGLAPGCASVNATHVVCAPLVSAPYMDVFTVFVNDTTAHTQNKQGAFWISAPATIPTVLSIGARAGYTTPSFWGFNYNFPQGTPLNSTFAAYLNQTPVRSIRMELNNTVYAYPIGGGYTNWSQAWTWCQWVHCRPEITVGWQYEWTQAQFATILSNLTALGIKPALWVYGNEPDLWVQAFTKTPLQYANAENNFTLALRAAGLWGSAPVTGADINCNPTNSGPYVQNVSRVDGPNLTYFNVQPYTNLNTSDSAVNMLQGEWGAPAALPICLPTLKAAAKVGCPTCYFQWQQGEGAPASGNFFGDVKTGPFMVTANAVEAVIALQSNLAVWRQWTFVTAPTHGTCAFGTVYFIGTCRAIGYNWDWPLYTSVYSQIGRGSVFNVTASANTQWNKLWGVSVENGPSWAVLLVNANLSVAQTVQLGAGFPATARVTSYAYRIAAPQVATVSTFSIAPVGSTTITLPPGEVLLLNVTGAQNATSSAGSFFAGVPTSTVIPFAAGSALFLAWLALAVWSGRGTPRRAARTSPASGISREIPTFGEAVA